MSLALYGFRGLSSVPAIRVGKPPATLPRRVFSCRHGSCGSIGHGPQSGWGCIPTQSATAIKLSRHTGMDCRYPGCMDASSPHHPWNLDSGIPCRNDEQFLNLMAVMQSVGTINPAELGRVGV